MQCKQCSSIDFEKISPGEYRCKYCGAIQIIDGRSGSPLLPSIRGLNNKKVRTSLIVIGAAVVLTVLFGYFFTARQAPGPGFTDSIPVGPEKMSEFGSEDIEEEVTPEGKFTDVAEVPDSIGNVYFIGMYRNTGKSPMRKPLVSVTLYNKAGRKVAAGRGYGVRDILLPGEETPVKILVNNPPGYERYEIEHNPEPPYSFSTYNRPKLTFDNVKVAKGKYSGYEVTGEVYNKSGAGAKYVEVVAVLFDENKKIIGSGRDYVKTDILKSGDYSPFRVGVTSVMGIPQSFKLDYSGRLLE